MGTEAELERVALKLLRTLHLSVPERQEIPSDGLPASLLARVVRAHLTEREWFPEPPPSDGIWNGARLQVRESEIWVHEQHEIGVNRFGPPRSRQVNSIAEAVRAFVEATPQSTASRSIGQLDPCS
jgi:hypothetical protein